MSIGFFDLGLSEEGEPRCGRRASVASSWIATPRSG